MHTYMICIHTFTHIQANTDILKAEREYDLNAAAVLKYVHR